MTTRRTVLTAGAALTGLAACAGCAGPSETTTPAPTTPAGTGGGTGGSPEGGLARVADLGEGVPTSVPVGGATLLLVRTGDAVVGFSPVCPHQGCQVVPAEAIFACPCHGSEFAADGGVLRGPATEGLSPVELVVGDGWVSLA